MNFKYPLVDYLKSREKELDNSLKTKRKEISKEGSEEKYKIWHKNTYNPLLNYFNFSKKK